MTFSLMSALLCLIRFLVAAAALRSSSSAIAAPSKSAAGGHVAAPTADPAAEGAASATTTDRHPPALAADAARPGRRARPTTRWKTADDFLGTVTLALTAHLVLTHNDECSRCGTHLSVLYAIYLADCGRYCSRGCANAHAEILAGAAYVAGL